MEQASDIKATSTPKKKKKGSLNTKKTFKQIRARTFLSVVLIVSLMIYFYVSNENEKKERAKFQTELLQEIKKNNETSQQKMDSIVWVMDSIITVNNVAVIKSQRLTTSQIQQSIKTLREQRSKNE